MVENGSPKGFFRTRSGVALIGFLAIAGYFLWTEHRAHALVALPYLLLAACPLMHLFHHHGHGGHDHDDGGERHEADGKRR